MHEKQGGYAEYFARNWGCHDTNITGWKSMPVFLQIIIQIIGYKLYPLKHG